MLGRTSGTGARAKLSISVQSTAKELETDLARSGTLASSNAAEKRAKATDAWPSGLVLARAPARSRAVCSTWR